MFLHYFMLIAMCLSKSNIMTGSPVTQIPTPSPTPFIELIESITLMRKFCNCNTTKPFRLVKQF